VNFELHKCCGFDGELSTLWFMVSTMSCNFVNKEL
jgi:hypothetical protein